MTEDQFNMAFEEDKIQVAYFWTVEGRNEKAVMTSGIQTSTTGNKFVRLTRYRESSVNLDQLTDLKTIGEW